MRTVSSGFDTAPFTPISLVVSNASPYPETTLANLVSSDADTQRWTAPPSAGLHTFEDDFIIPIFRSSRGGDQDLETPLPRSPSARPLQPTFLQRLMDYGPLELVSGALYTATIAIAPLLGLSVGIALGAMVLAAKIPFVASGIAKTYDKTKAPSWDTVWQGSKKSLPHIATSFAQDPIYLSILSLLLATKLVVMGPSWVASLAAYLTATIFATGLQHVAARVLPLARNELAGWIITVALQQESPGEKPATQELTLTLPPDSPNLGFLASMPITFVPLIPDEPGDSSTPVTQLLPKSTDH